MIYEGKNVIIEVNGKNVSIPIPSLLYIGSPKHRTPPVLVTPGVRLQVCNGIKISTSNGTKKFSRSEYEDFLNEISKHLFEGENSK